MEQNGEEQVLPQGSQGEIGSERWQSGLVINEGDTSPRIGLQKRQHFLNAISSDKTQTLTDAEEICRMGFLGSALNLPQHIGSQRKLSQMIKELD